MNISLGEPIYFEAPFVADKQGKNGLTVTVTVRRDGVALVTNAATTEVGDGLYSFTLLGTNTTQAGRYTAVFKTTNEDVDSQVAYSLWVVGAAWVQNLDASLSSIKAKTDNIVVGGATQANVTAVGNAVGTVGTAIGILPTANQNADALLDRADIIGTGFTLRKLLRGFAAVLLGKKTLTAFRDLADTKNVVTYTANEDGTRTTTLDLT